MRYKAICFFASFFHSVKVAVANIESRFMHTHLLRIRYAIGTQQVIILHFLMVLLPKQLTLAL